MKTETIRRPPQRNKKLEQQRALQLQVVGTRVAVALDNGDTLLTKTTSLPWALGHGDVVVKVDGQSGGFDILRVTVDPPCVAYCWANGVIEFGEQAPENSLIIASGGRGQLDQIIGTICRHGYPTKRGGNDGKLLVPGVPEAPNQSAGVDAVIAFSKEVEKLLDQPQLRYD